MEMIEKYPNKRWDWLSISKNPNITMEIIEKYPNKPWSWWGVSANPNITVDIIEKYPDKPWKWKSPLEITPRGDLSENPNITLNLLKSILINLGFGEKYLETQSYYGIY